MWQIMNMGCFFKCIILFQAFFFVSIYTQAKESCDFQKSSNVPEIQDAINAARPKGKGFRGKDPQYAAIFGEDNRIAIPKMRPYSSVVKTSAKSKNGVGNGTAFFIDECTIVSINHNFENTKTGERYINPSIRTVDGEEHRIKNMTSIGVEKSNQRISFSQVEPNSRGEFAGERLGAFEIEKMDPFQIAKTGWTFCLPGHNADSGPEGSVDRSVQVKGRASDMLGDHNSPDMMMMVGSATYGASGGPIFKCPLNADGTTNYSDPVVVGVYVGSMTDEKNIPDRKNVDPKKMALGIATSAFFDQYIKYAKEHPCGKLKKPGPQIASKGS